ncbi:MAG: FecR family protein [Planctomycetes bacterium]|nr:FecR family protein [Planctomycetota bacterium]
MFARTANIARCCLVLACMAGGVASCADGAATGRKAADAPVWHDATALQVQSVHVLRAKDGADGEFEYLPADAVRIQRRGETYDGALTSGTFIGAQDTLITGSDRIVQVRFSDGTLLVLGRHSRLRVTDRYLSKGGLGTVLTLYEGIVRVQVSELAARGGFYLHASAASVQVSKPCGLVVRQQNSERMDGASRTDVTLLFGACQVLPAGKTETGKENVWNLETSGEKLVAVDSNDVEPKSETLAVAALGKLTAEVPFLFAGAVRLAEKVELPGPVDALASVEKVSLAPYLPDAIPGPPALDDPAFQFLPSGSTGTGPHRLDVPPGLTPTNGVSPSGP